jgi:hypothetical protein
MLTKEQIDEIRQRYRHEQAEPIDVGHLLTHVVEVEAERDALRERLNDAIRELDF